MSSKTYDVGPLMVSTMQVSLFQSSQLPAFECFPSLEFVVGVHTMYMGLRYRTRVHAWDNGPLLYDHFGDALSVTSVFNMVVVCGHIESNNLGILFDSIKQHVFVRPTLSWWE